MQIFNREDALAVLRRHLMRFRQFTKIVLFCYRFDQDVSSWIKSDQIGSIWINLDQFGSIKLDQLDQSNLI